MVFLVSFICLIDPEKGQLVVLALVGNLSNSLERARWQLSSHQRKSHAVSLAIVAWKMGWFTRSGYGFVSLISESQRLAVGNSLFAMLVAYCLA